jgi:polyisoprenoid-binding protein YceI
VKVTFVLFAAFHGTGTLQAETFRVDQANSIVRWNGKKVTGEHHGTIAMKSGIFDVTNKTITGGSVEIDMTSILNEDIKDAAMNGRLVGHLRSDDFFSVEKFPVSRLQLREIKNLTGNEVEYTGDLTIKGITHPVTFRAITVVDGNILKANGKITVNRAKYDVRYGSGAFFSNLGDKLIYDDFTLDFSIEAVKNI